KGDDVGSDGNPYALWVLALLPVLFILVVGIHELGHVAAGLTQRFNFYGLTIGPFSWKPDAEGKIRFSWNTQLNVAGGVAMMLPEGTERLRQRFMWFAAGGPLASLLLALLAFGISRLVAEDTFLALLFVAIGAFSATICVATLLPFRAGGFASDGLRILTFARNGKTAAADLASLRALAHMRAGQPYEALPAADFAAAATDPATPEQQKITLNYYRYLHALGTGEFDAAAELLEGVMAKLDVYPDGAQYSFYAEQALFEAKYRRNLPAAEAAWAQFQENPFSEALSVHLAKAAQAELREDYVTLAAELPGIEKGLTRTIDQSRVPLINEWLKEWRSMADNDIS
ncbi:MAG: site-2 protease family protein, partial [Bacteroidota bacterium]